MVFGSTYCLISRLEIKEGDKFYLIPIYLNLNLKEEEGIYTPYQILIDKFLSENIFLNIWKGNYFIGHPKEYFLYFSIHKGFYDDLMKDFKYNPEYIKDLPKISFCKDLDNYIESYKKEYLENLNKDFEEGKVTRDEYIFKTLNIEVPEQIKNLYRLAFFMDKMGIIPYPNIVNDQHNFGTILNSIKKKYV